MADQSNPGDSQGAKFRADVEQIQHDLGRLRNDFSDLISSLVGVSKTGAGTARERIDAGLQEIKKGMATAREHGGEALECAQKKIQERPIVSVLVALGLGLLIGKLMDRRGE